jgi:hypothetical protein
LTILYQLIKYYYITLYNWNNDSGGIFFLAKIILQNVEYKSNMTGATSGAGTTFLPELQNMTGATSGAGTTFLPKLQNMTGATSGA